jgi:ferredoxin-NADP reductase
MSNVTAHDHHHDHSSWQSVKLIGKKEVAESTMAFFFEKPAGLTFKAGQHFNVQLINPPETDDEGNIRHFSLVCSPSDNELMITTRMRDTAFKRVLGAMEIGSSVNIGMPHGSYVLHNDTAKAAIFLIGGIGITPILSMVKDATERNLPHKLILLYSNNRPEDAPFLEELQGLANQNPHFTFVPTMTNMEKSQQSWSGETGYIDQTMLEKYVANPQAAIYYLSGPSAMIAVMHTLLMDWGIEEDSILTEEFTGY